MISYKKTVKLNTLVMLSGLVVIAAGVTVSAACTADEPCVECTGDCAESHTEPTKGNVEERPVCPECGLSGDVVQIIYGFPGPELREAADRGEVFLGGCVLTGDDPQWYCKSCGHKW